MILGLDFRVCDLKFGNFGLGLGVWIFGFRILDFWFEV